MFKDKIQQLEEDLAEERKNAVQVEDKFDKYKDKMQMQEESFKQIQKQLAQMEIENDELKNNERQMGFMVEDIEQKLDSQLELNELLREESIEQKQDYEEQVERLK